MLPIEDCSGVYIIINRINGKKYIGSSCMVERRIKVHFKFKGSVVLSHAIKKYGSENFETFILEKRARKHLPCCEGKWIQKLKPEYNLTIITKTGGRTFAPESIAKSVAGRAGYTHSPETRLMMGNSNRGKKRSVEQCERISIGRKRSPLAKAHILKLIAMHTGKKQSAEKIEARVASLRGRKMSKEFCENLRQKNIGKKMSEEAKLKMSLAKRGKSFHSEERKAKLSKLMRENNPVQAAWDRGAYANRKPRGPANQYLAAGEQA